MAKNNVLTEEFLYELYNSCFEHDYVCNVVCEYMKNEYLPSRGFQKLHEIVKAYYRKNGTAPNFNMTTHLVSNCNEAKRVLSDMTYNNGEIKPDILLEQFEIYLKNVKFQLAYKEMGELYARGEREKALDKLVSFSQWLQEFTLRGNAFIDVIGTFKERFLKNREQHNQESKTKPVTRFYIDSLDEMNGGRDLRGQLSCFLAATGVGKSHAARWIGKCATQVDGLNVLHFQLEGSEKETVDAYSASLVERSSYRYSTGTFSDRELESMVKSVSGISGSLMVRAYPRFATQVSTVDIKNGIAEYRKLYGKVPDIVIIDSMDLLNDSSGRHWTEKGERHKRIAVANDLKDLAAEYNIWIVTTYQATIENREWLNDENNVLTEYNCAEAKGLSRPLSHLVTLNQSTNEMKEDMMRIFVAKSRFFKKGDPIKIATDYDNEIFYDRSRTLTINKML